MSMMRRPPALTALLRVVAETPVYQAQPVSAVLFRSGSCASVTADALEGTSAVSRMTTARMDAALRGETRLRARRRRWVSQDISSPRVSWTAG